MVPSGKKKMKADDMVLTGVGYLHRVIMQVLYEQMTFEGARCQEGASHAQWWREGGSMCEGMRQEELGMSEEKKIRPGEEGHTGLS